MIMQLITKDAFYIVYIRYFLITHTCDICMYLVNTFSYQYIGFAGKKNYSYMWHILYLHILLYECKSNLCYTYDFVVCQSVNTQYQSTQSIV